MVPPVTDTNMKFVLGQRESKLTQDKMDQQLLVWGISLVGGRKASSANVLATFYIYVQLFGLYIRLTAVWATFFLHLCAIFFYKVLGTPVEAIMATEDRDIFNQKLAGERYTWGQ